jgi:hypothetical protein
MFEGYRRDYQVKVSDRFTPDSGVVGELAVPPGSGLVQL